MWSDNDETFSDKERGVEADRYRRSGEALGWTGALMGNLAIFCVLFLLVRVNATSYVESNRTLEMFLSKICCRSALFGKADTEARRHAAATRSQRI